MISFLHSTTIKYLHESYMMRYLFSVFFIYALICLYSCSEIIDTEIKQETLNAYFRTKWKEYCPQRGLVGGIERGITAEGDDKIVRIRHCILDERGWIDRIDYYDYSNCRGPYCINLKLYFSYYVEEWKYKICVYKWIEGEEYWEKEEPCQTLIVEL